MVGEIMGYPSGKGSSKSRGAWKEYWIIENKKKITSLWWVPWFPSAAGVNKSWCLIIFSRLTTPTQGSTMSLQVCVLKEYCNKKKSVQHCNTVSTCEIKWAKTHLKVAAYRGGGRSEVCRSKHSQKRATETTSFYAKLVLFFCQQREPEDCF